MMLTTSPMQATTRRAMNRPRCCLLPAGLRSFPEFSPYCASKHALMGIVKSAAAEYAGRVRINCVCPATIDTPMVAWFAQRWPDFQVRAGHACLAVLVWAVGP